MRPTTSLRSLPTLKITKQDPPNGPIAGDPFTVEFEATSPVGRAVQVHWRRPGDTMDEACRPETKNSRREAGRTGLRVPGRRHQRFRVETTFPAMGVSSEVRRFTGHERWVNSIAVTPDAKYVVSGSGDKWGNKDWDNTVRVWDWRRGRKCGGSRGTSVTSIASR
jgi:WD40 repeat protein